MKNLLLLLAIGSLITLTSFTFPDNKDVTPKAVTRTTEVINGDQVEKTVILLDGNTSREDVIHACNFLAVEDVQLTFDKLVIGKSMLGLVGKSQIRFAEGKIALPNGSSEKFKAGGAASFRFIRIQYSKNTVTNSSQIDMIEKVD
ncbi:hypothetical protein ACFS7Z_00190 [Pontibacter toksunensis]|uniref:Uncharacterized protein n=1 Tax=Pontibacter toksunensis TaxID=1332631 RepID=A0ABW6BNB7_9BACT